MNFAASLSGLNGAATAIDMIGDNISNSQTVGFKRSQAQFAEVLAASLPGGAPIAGDFPGGPPAGAAGVGVSTTITRRDDQGTIAESGNPLDMAIRGQGFFRLDQGGEITYSRDGQFQLVADAATPSQCLLVNGAGCGVTGYLADFAADPQGVIATTSAPQDISFDAVMAAAATSKASIRATLDAGATPPSIAPFAASEPLTYNTYTALTTYDATGAAHDLRVYFVKSSPGNLWDLYTTLDGGSQTGPLSLSFDTTGALSTSMPLPAQTYPLSAGGSLSVALDLSKTVQYGNAFNFESVSQDGWGEGAIDGAKGLSVGNDGVIQAFYTNGQSRNVAQVVLANFVNPGAMIRVGDGRWKANGEPLRGTGAEILDTPGRASGGMGLGSLQAGAREQSNVDLNTELVALIEQQRNYQANAQTFKILDQVLQNLANLGK